MGFKVSFVTAALFRDIHVLMNLIPNPMVDGGLHQVCG